MSRDYALVELPDGKVQAHLADCATVRWWAAFGQPVLTMLGCEKPLPADLQRHECLKVEQ